MGRMRRRVTGVVLAGVLTLAAGTALAPAASADDGLTVSASSRYVLQAKDTSVEATVTLDLRNVTPNQTTSNGIYQYYYNGFSVPVPAGAEDLVATSNGGTLSVSTAATEDDSTAVATIRFSNLFYNQSRRITFTYSIPGAPPRSSDWTRVGRGYATFIVSSPGDPGHNEVEVVVPSGMSFESTMDAFEQTTKGSRDVWTATENTDDTGIWAVVSLRDPDLVEEKTVEVSGTSVTLEAFPDDTRWLSFVTGAVTDGIPALEDLVGNDWPGGLQRIREDASPSLRGYDGWFDSRSDEIVVGEALDDDLILHELSHAWLSEDRFEHRWQYEGLAQVVAERAMLAEGKKPFTHPNAARTAKAAVPLNRWDGGAGTRSTDLEAWAYPASYRVTSELLDSLDDEQFAAVVGAGIRGERAYDPPGTTDHTGGRTTWKRWLDLVETRGDTTGASKVFSTWVLTTKQKADLKGRAAARKAYAALDEGDGAWTPPEGLRSAMTGWDWKRAADVREQVAGLGADAVAVQQAAEATGLDVPFTVRDSYQDAALDEQYAALGASLPTAAAAITAVGAATDAAEEDQGPFGELGQALLGIDDSAQQAKEQLTRGDIDAARATADDVTDRAGWVMPLGVGLPLLVLLVVAGLVVLVVALLRRRSQRPQHAGVAEGVGLDPLEVQELRDPLVVAPQQLGVDGGGDRLALDRLEAVAREERHLEGQAEQPRQPELPRPVDEPVEHGRPDTSSEEGRFDGEGADLPEVLPEDVDRSTADDPAR
jgi:hypothetical protein